MAVAVLMKERNIHMTGVQSILSLLLFAARVDKQVSNLPCTNCLLMLTPTGLYTSESHQCLFELSSNSPFS